MRYLVDPNPLPALMITDPLETSLWIDALAEHCTTHQVVPTGHDDVVSYLKRFRPRARA